MASGIYESSGRLLILVPLEAPGGRMRWSSPVSGKEVQTAYGSWALSQIKGNAAVIPLSLVNWQMADDWKFKLGIQQLGAVGYGPEVIWTASDEWEFGVGASFQKRRYRLDDSVLPAALGGPN